MRVGVDLAKPGFEVKGSVDAESDVGRRTSAARNTGRRGIERHNFVVIWIELGREAVDDGNVEEYRKRKDAADCQKRDEKTPMESDGLSQIDNVTSGKLICPGSLFLFAHSIIEMARQVT